MNDEAKPKKTSRFWFWLALLAGLPLVLFAVSVIPWNTATLLVPEGVIHVVDEQGRPLANARVTVRRYRVGPPPRVESHRFERMSDNRGEVSFEMKLGVERIFPLLLHGVPQWGFEICATKTGYRGVSGRWLVVDRRKSPQENARSMPLLVLKLVPGAGACPWPKLSKGR